MGVKVIRLAVFCILVTIMASLSESMRTSSALGSKSEYYCSSYKKDCPEGYYCSGGYGALKITRCCPYDFKYVYFDNLCSGTCIDRDGDACGIGCLWPDCDDDDPQRNFILPEWCDGIDNNCNNLIDENCRFKKGIPVKNSSGCKVGKCTNHDYNCDGIMDEFCFASDEICSDGIDNDMDGVTDDGCCGSHCDQCGKGLLNVCDEEECAKTDTCKFNEVIFGYGTCDNDCIDHICTEEICNGIDDDCDSIVDEDCISPEYRNTEGMTNYTLKIITYIDHVGVSKNGRHICYTERKNSLSLLSSCTITNVPRGEHVITHTKEGYSPIRKRINLQEDTFYIVYLSRACGTDEDCWWNNVCSNNTKSCQKKMDCITVKASGNPDEKIDMLLIGAEYSESEFRSEVKKLIDEWGDSGYNGLFSVEPFKSNKDRFNIYKVLAPDFKFIETGEFVEGNAVSEPVDDMKQYFEVCQRGGNIIDIPILLSKESFFISEGEIYDTHVSLKNVNDKHKGRLFLHELGHTLGDLRDEFVDPRRGSSTGDTNCVESLEKAKELWGDLAEMYEEVDYFNGCSYVYENIRPVQNSIMNDYLSIDDDFGPVNERILRERILGEELTHKEDFSLEYPVIFLHGWGSDVSVFKEMQEKLEEEKIAKNEKYFNDGDDAEEACGLKGWNKSVTTSFEYYSRDFKVPILPASENLGIEEYGRRLNKAVETIKKCTGADQVTIVAHSMGGLVARSYMHQFGTESVNQLITLATPHYGATYKVVFVDQVASLVKFGIYANARRHAYYFPTMGLTELTRNIDGTANELYLNLFEDVDIGVADMFAKDSLDMMPQSDFLIELNSQDCDNRKLITSIATRTLAERMLDGVIENPKVDGCFDSPSNTDPIVSQVSGKLLKSRQHIIECWHTDMANGLDGMGGITSPEKCPEAYNIVKGKLK